MANISIHNCTNANVYVDGANFIGRCEEATLPQIKAKMSTKKGLGMLSEMEIFSGIDKMEAKFKWNSFYPDVMKKSANFTKGVQIQVRSSIDVLDGNSNRTDQLPLVATLRGTFKELPGGAFKQQDNVELESTFNVIYYKLQIDGETIVEVDQINNKYVVDGEDLMAAFRENIGG